MISRTVRQQKSDIKYSKTNKSFLDVRQPVNLFCSLHLTYPCEPIRSDFTNGDNVVNILLAEKFSNFFFQQHFTSSFSVFTVFVFL